MPSVFAWVLFQGSREIRKSDKIKHYCLFSFHFLSHFSPIFTTITCNKNARREAQTHCTVSLFSVSRKDPQSHLSLGLVCGKTWHYINSLILTHTGIERLAVLPHIQCWVGQAAAPLGQGEFLPLTPDNAAAILMELLGSVPPQKVVQIREAHRCAWLPEVRSSICARFWPHVPFTPVA